MSATKQVRHAVITGAGSGVGRATAVMLSRDGWRVALIGRRPETLKETAAMMALPADSTHPLVCPCDIGDEGAVAFAGREILTQFGWVDALVNAAGTNIPRRGFDVLASSDYRHLVDTNLNGPYWCVQAFLPSMRQRGSGTIVNVVSEAARQASPKAGPAYSASKFGLLGLTQAINAEERARGIRACALMPGDIDTPLLDKRPTPPGAEARARMLRPEDVADCIRFVLELPPRAVVEELLLRPA